MKTSVQHGAATDCPAVLQPTRVPMHLCSSVWSSVKWATIEAASGLRVASIVLFLRMSVRPRVLQYAIQRQGASVFVGSASVTTPSCF